MRLSPPVQRFSKEMEQEFGAIDVLVNNAGFAFKGSDPTPFAEQVRCTAVALQACVCCARLHCVTCECATDAAHFVCLDASVSCPTLMARRSACP
jgi:NAD(P)-dependent dehydrogenase (short-subunit alcohol dehydrogenase family)